MLNNFQNRNLYVSGKQFTRFGVVYLFNEYIQRPNDSGPKYIQYKAPKSIMGLLALPLADRKRAIKAIAEYKKK